MGTVFPIKVQSILHAIIVVSHAHPATQLQVEALIALPANDILAQFSADTHAEPFQENPAAQEQVVLLMAVTALRMVRQFTRQRVSELSQVKPVMQEQVRMSMEPPELRIELQSI